jgi:transcriptional regulator with PAS, ATPase and Fis domain
MIQEGRFRADLSYRLNIYPRAIPPLRERQDNIPLLLEHFVHKFALRHGKSIPRIPKTVMEILKNHPWAGNVRELQNFVERAVIRSAGNALELSFADLPPLADA